MKKTIIFTTSLVFIVSILIYFLLPTKTSDKGLVLDSNAGQEKDEREDSAPEEKEELEKEILHPLSIKSLRTREYPGGDFIIEETLSNGTNYSQYIASYFSEGLKIYGLLTIPLGEKPNDGFPAIVFVHGYIPPKEYSTTGNYPTYQASLARSGFITFKPDLRGHGNSEGDPVSAHYSEKYIIDTMQAISYLKEYPETDKDNIFYWGHSNGGQIGLRVALISPDIKAASLWAGVVGSQKHMWETYVDIIPFLDTEENPLINEHGLPSENNDFWDDIDPYYFLDEIKTPIELQHGTNDDSVPIILSEELRNALEDKGKEVIYHIYQNDDHNIGNNSSLAFRRTIDFYRDNLTQ